MQSQAKEYVVGFMFGPSRGLVALIRKSKPAWQAGKLNGIGGGIEQGEAPVAAMVREFQEETEVATSMDQWKMFCEIGGTNDDGGQFVVYFFVTTGNLNLLKLPTEEPVEIHRLEELHSQRTDMIENLAWLLALAVDHHTDGRPNYVIASYGEWTPHKQVMHTLTCVYCGREYPQGTPASGSEVLTEHIKQCEKHPMKNLRKALADLVGASTRIELVRLKAGMLKLPDDENRRLALGGINALMETAT